MKCFFVLSSKGWVEQFQDMALVLAKSAKINCKFDMYCIYDGEPNVITGKLEELGVHVLFHKPAYVGLLETGARRGRRGRGGIWADPALWNGAFLRLEIPLLVRELGFRDKFVLYVDTDTFFQSEPPLDLIHPRYLAAASESDPKNKRFFNSGVMVLNVRSMVETYPQFIQFCIDNDFAPKSGVIDQGLYNIFYRTKWQHLDAEYNWKAYWPINPRASIIHFHGPNPAHIADYLA
jgi:hypothetical protein